MHWIFSAGPIETDEGPSHVLTLMRDELPVEIEAAPTRLEGLRALLEHVEGERVRVSGELHEEARALGLQVAPLPQSLAMLRASQAMMLANGEIFEDPENEGPLELIAPLLEFVDAAPWTWLDGDTPVRVQFRKHGRKLRTLEASVLGRGQQVLGLALYDRPGSIAKLAHACGDQLSMPNNVVVLTLDDEPEWAADAVRAAFDLPGFPSLLRIRHRRPARVSAADLDNLGGALWAISQLDEDTLELEGELEEDEQLTIHVRVMPSLDQAPAPRPARPKVPRNARCPCGSGRKYKRCCLPLDEASALE